MNKRVLLLSIITIFLTFYRLGDRAIIFTDELLIEDGAYSMAHGGSLIIPEVRGNPHLVKPPLLYWLSAPLYLLYPPQPWMRRFWTAIFGIMLVFLTYKLSKLFFDEKTAFWSSLFLSTSAPFIYFTKTGNFDLPNAFFITLTIYWYNLSKKNHVFLFLCSTSLAFAILNRSFLALIPLIVIAFDYMLFPRLRPKFLLILASTLLLIAIIAPWHFLAYSQEPQMFIEQYLQIPLVYHALGALTGEQAPSRLFYLTSLLLFPVSFIALWGVGKTLLHVVVKAVKPVFLINRAFFQLITWVAALTFILVLSPSQHQWYIFPIYLPLAMFSAFSFIKLRYKTKKGSTKYHLIVLCLFTFLISPSIALFLTPFPQAEVITAVSKMEENSRPKDKLYVWRHDFVPVTRFYPNRLVKIIDRQNIPALIRDNQPIFILIANSDRNSLPKNINPEVIYQGNKFTLLKE